MKLVKVCEEHIEWYLTTGADGARAQPYQLLNCIKPLFTTPRILNDVEIKKSITVQQI